MQKETEMTLNLMRLAGEGTFYMKEDMSNLPFQAHNTQDFYEIACKKGDQAFKPQDKIYG